MTLPADMLEKGRAGLRQVFTYLQALNELRNPIVSNVHEHPWMLFLAELPQHPLVQRGFIATQMADVGRESENADEAEAADYVLKVTRPGPLKPCPVPPAEIIAWVSDGWQKIDAETAKLPERIAFKNGERVTEEFEDDSARKELFAKWLAVRKQWQQSERPAYETQKLFDRLYALHGQLEREGEQFDLVLGDGMLNWHHGSGSIRHPLLLKRVQLRFEPKIPEFTFVETSHAPEFYAAPFRVVSEIHGASIRDIRDQVEANSIHPLGGDETETFLQRVAAILHARGTYTSSPPPNESPSVPQIGRKPVIFMRKRTAGLSFAIECILEDLKTCTTLPPSLLNIVGVESPPATEVAGAPDPLSLANESEEVLFSKPANLEQLQIAQRLQKYGCVLVQGPPGTGKSHTIANLLGHLLAHGKVRW